MVWGPKNHDSQRRDRILRFLLRLDIGQFSPHLGRFSYEITQKREKATGEHSRKSSGRVLNWNLGKTLQLKSQWFESLPFEIASGLEYKFLRRMVLTLDWGACLDVWQQAAFSMSLPLSGYFKSLLLLRMSGKSSSMALVTGEDIESLGKP